MKTSYMPRRLAFVATVAVATLTTVGVGPSSPASAQQSVKGYPAVKVVDLKTGKTVSLASNNGGKLPTLAWFWAPS